MLRSKLQLENRIALLKSRGKDNYNIINKLNRQLRLLKLKETK